MAKIIQNAYQTPDGTILLSKGKNKVQYFDTKSKSLFHLCGSNNFSENNIDDNCCSLFLFETSTIADFKNKLVWRTRGVIPFENKTEPYIIRLKDLSTEHLKSIFRSRNTHSLYRFIIELILQDRNEHL